MVYVLQLVAFQSNTIHHPPTLKSYQQNPTHVNSQMAFGKWLELNSVVSIKLIQHKTKAIYQIIRKPS